MGQTVFHSTYQRGSAADLMDYVEHEQGAELKDHMGRPLDGERQQQMIDKSEREQFQRHGIISPENAEKLDKSQIERATRDTMHEVTKDRESVQWAYTVHEDGGDRPHAHVVMVGDEEDLAMYPDELAEVREIAADKSKAVERSMDVAKKSVRKDKAVTETLKKGVSR